MNNENTDPANHGYQPSPHEVTAPGVTQGEHSFVLPDAECFQVLAGMAGQIRLVETTGGDSIDVGSALRDISVNMDVTYNGFRTGNLSQASEGLAAIVFNALVIAGVCEARAPGVFSGILDEIYQRMPALNE